jgi:hypothetical protein
MFDKYLSDYYRFKIDVNEIAEKEGVATTTFHRWLKRNGLTPRQKWFSKIKTGYPELDKVLHTRYIYMLKRCKYKQDDRYDRYKSMEYLSVIEYVSFCNENKENIARIWEGYTSGGRKPKYALSLDRIDNEDGYVVGNIKFVTHGFNSWKRSLFPVKVTHNSESEFFFSREEASRFYGLRKKTIGEIFSGMQYHLKGYDVFESTFEDVMEQKGTKTLEEYYKKYID